jgi:hypothetical protein
MRLIETFESLKLDKLLFEKEFSFITKISLQEGADDDVINVLYEILKKYNSKDVYISFRDSVTVNLINPTNIYRTPTGFYCYPLASIIEDKMGIKDLEQLKKMSKSDFFNSSYFPWRSDSEYLYVFHVSDNSNILYSSKNYDEKVYSYVLKLKELYSNNDSVQNLCDDFIKTGKVKSSRYKKEYEGVHGLWMLIFEIGVLLKDISNLNYFFTIVCSKIEISAFVDDAGKGMIHPNEPYNAVFFKLKSISDYFNIISKSKGQKFALPRDKEIIGPRYGTKKFKYEKRYDIPRV